jgi:hypothetical protein
MSLFCLRGLGIVLLTAVVLDLNSGVGAIRIYEDISNYCIKRTAERC